MRASDEAARRMERFLGFAAYFCSRQTKPPALRRLYYLFFPLKSLESRDPSKSLGRSSRIRRQNALYREDALSRNDGNLTLVPFRSTFYVESNTPLSKMVSHFAVFCLYDNWPSMPSLR